MMRCKGICSRCIIYKRQKTGILFEKIMSDRYRNDFKNSGDIWEISYGRKEKTSIQKEIQSLYCGHILLPIEDQRKLD